MESYNKLETLPYVRGLVQKLKHSQDRLRTERGILSISLNASYISPEEKNELREIVSSFETWEDRIESLKKRVRGRIKLLEKL